MQKVRRLFEQLQPESYDLSLIPDKKTMSFSGKVTIRGAKVGRPSKRITLHTKDLKIESAKIVLIDRSGEREIPVLRASIHKRFDELRLHSSEMLYPGKYIITIEFSGRITRPMSGIYPCYFRHEEKEEILIATQFESHHAREAFPCIDEPEAKAVFSLTLTTPKGETALANTEPIRSLDKGDSTVSVFAPTPKMSTYLVAFAFGRLDCLEKKTKSGIKVRTYATPAHVKHTAFALDTAVDCLELYNEYFGVDYPLSKCDLLALPDFASGAMENWGLITFREQALIVDADNTSLVMRQYVANVVAHELTHQWFGNLVTMKWWNDLWLNESFASLMAYVAVDKLFPEWKVWTQFIVDEQAPALRLDSLEHTHPINVAINHPDEIRTIFDNISYEKGASILFMLMKFLGEAPFREGLRIYLNRFRYANTESKDLWRAWEEAAAKPIGDFMDAWTKQEGFPLISVSQAKDQLTLTQQRFYLNPLAQKTETIWPLPLFAEPMLKQSVLGLQSQKFEAAAAGSVGIINHDRNAFCRVVYDPVSLASIKQRIESGDISELDRLGILSDSFEAARAGLAPTIDSLNLVDAYKNESSVVVWEIISVNIAGMRGVMDDEKLRQATNPWIVSLASKQFERLGWNFKAKEPYFDKLLRPIIIGMMAAADEPEVLREINRLFKERGVKPIHPDLRGVVYTTVARHGGRKEFDELLKIYIGTSSSEEKVALAAAITNFKQPELIKAALSEITGSTVKLQDATYWISYSFSNRYAKLLTWQWVKSHWQWLKDNLGADLSFYMMPRYASRAFSDERLIPEFKQFFEANTNESFARPIAQAIETITWQSQWRKRDLAPIKQYFQSDKT